MAKRKRQAKKMEAVKSAAQKVKEDGGTDEEAREAGLKAAKMFDTLIEKQAMMAQQPEKK